MLEKKRIKNQIILDLIMIPVSVFMTIDYSFLIIAGDDSLRKKIALSAWVISIIGWSIKFLYDLKKKKTYS